MTYSIDSALEILERTPRLLQTYLENLSDEWIFSNEGDDTWSAFDVIGHLIHGEKTDWIERLKIIRSDSSDKTFPSFDRFAQFENSKSKSLNYLLKEFAMLRTQNLDYLKTLELSDEDLDQKGIHPQLGDVTLRQLLSTWTVHDLGHIAQISRVMAKQLKTEVGPWRAYLTVLNKRNA